MCEYDSVECDSDTPLPAASDNLLDVFEAVFDVTDWKRLGLFLGLYNPTLKMIERDCKHKFDECKMEMMAAWLRQQDNVPHNGLPSWSVLQAALRKMRKSDLADRIMDYIGMCAPPPPHPVPPLSDL